MTEKLKVLRYGLFAAAFAMPATAFAENWVRVGENSNGAVFYYDADSIAFDGKTAAIWIKTDHSQDKTVKRRQSKKRNIYDCEARTVFISVIVDYDKFGRVIFSHKYSKIENPEADVVPGSIGEAYMEIACSANAAQ